MQLDHADVLNRFVLKKSHIRPDGVIDAKAFMLAAKDHGKLSTFREAELEAGMCAKKFNPAYGCAAFMVAAVVEVENEMNRGIRPEYDPELADICPGHTSILNLPNPDDEKESILAERAASILRNNSKRVL